MKQEVSTTDAYNHPICPACGFPMLSAECSVCEHSAVQHRKPFFVTAEALGQAISLCQAYKAGWSLFTPKQQAERLSSVLRLWYDGVRCIGCLMGEHPR